MLLPERAITLVKNYEGWHRRLSDDRAAPYLCPANVWTIGYGATFDATGKAITKDTPPITREEGEKLLMLQLEIFRAGTEKLIDPSVKLNANQLGALTSFSFNLGLGRLKSSTLLKRVNSGDFDGAAAEFPKWVMAGGRKLEGLVRRRNDEAALFLSPAQAQSPLGTVGLPLANEKAEVPSEDTWISRFLRGFNLFSKGS
jgi:lysozyme